MSSMKNSGEQSARTQSQRAAPRGKRGAIETNNSFVHAFADALRDILRDETGSPA